MGNYLLVIGGKIFHNQLYVNTIQFSPIQPGNSSQFNQMMMMIEKINSQKRQPEQLKFNVLKITSNITSKNKTYINIPYLFPFLLIFYLVLDCVYEFSMIGFHYNPTLMPELFTHKIYPQNLWFISDYIILMAISMMISIYGLLLFGSVFDPLYLIYVNTTNIKEIPKSKPAIQCSANRHQQQQQNGHYTKTLFILNENGPVTFDKEYQQLCSLYNEIRKFSTILTFCAVFFLESYVLGNFFFLNWTGSTKDYVFLFVIPLATMYASISK